MSTHQVCTSVLEQKEDQRSVPNLWLQEDNSVHPEKQPGKERKERVGVGVVRDESGEEGRVSS